MINFSDSASIRSWAVMIAFVLMMLFGSAIGSAETIILNDPIVVTSTLDETVTHQQGTTFADNVIVGP